MYGKHNLVSKSQIIQIQVSSVSISYDNYRRHLKSHLDSKELKSMGVYSLDYSTYSFSLGGLTFMVDDNVATPDFLGKSIKQKGWDSTVGYIKSSLPLNHLEVKP